MVKDSSNIEIKEETSTNISKISKNVIKSEIELSIIIPAYNEEDRIQATLDKYLIHFEKLLGQNFELIVIINGSKDKTLEIVKGFSRYYPQLKYLDIPLAVGKGGALTEGFKFATGKIIGFTDADASTSSLEYARLYQILLEKTEYDCVIASRALPESVVIGRSGNLLARSKGFNFGVNFLFNLGIKDTQCGAKLIRREMVQKIINSLSIANMAFDVNLLVDIRRNHGKILEVAIRWEDAEGSKVGNSFKTSLTMALSVVRLRIIYSFLRPLFPIINIIARPLYVILVNNKQSDNYEKWKKMQSEKRK